MSEVPRESVAADVDETAVTTGRTGLLLLPPVQPLRNKYTFVRAGESQREAAGLIETNAAWKLSVGNGLTDLGLKQAEQAAAEVAEKCELPMIWYSTARASQQTADVLAARLGVANTQRLMPEYVMLDARGFGVHEGESLSLIPGFHRAYDARSRYLRPPEGEDGSYAEAIEDAFARIRQVLSICETLYCGEDVVIVAPGSDLLSIADAALHGPELRTHYERSFAPGEVRYIGDLPDAKPWASTRTSTEPGPAWAANERMLIERKRADVIKVRADSKWAAEETRRDAQDEKRRVGREDKRLEAVAKAAITEGEAFASTEQLVAVAVAGLAAAAATSFGDKPEEEVTVRPQRRQPTPPPLEQQPTALMMVGATTTTTTSPVITQVDDAPPPADVVDPYDALDSAWLGDIADIIAEAKKAKKENLE